MTKITTPFYMDENGDIIVSKKHNIAAVCIFCAEKIDGRLFIEPSEAFFWAKNWYTVCMSCQKEDEENPQSGPLGMIRVFNGHSYIDCGIG